jgi:outer membrane immunogenic protein
MVRLLSILCAFIGISGSALAADLPPAPPPRAPAAYAPPVLPVFNWTGFYIGGNLGAAWTSVQVTDNLGNSWSNTQQGVFTGGGQIGANYQFSWAVVGVEAAFDWLANNHNSSRAVSVPAAGGDTLQLSANDRWITTLAARFGVAADNWLFYGKAGGAWVGIGSPTVTDLTTGGSITASNSNSTTGWLAGAGVEWGFASNWTAKLEYNFIGLNDSHFTVTSGPALLVGDSISTHDVHVQTLTLGINYLFH